MQRFVCVDCETTGLDKEKDCIIEVAAARFTLRENLESCQTLVDPCCPIPEESRRIHHISDDMVRGKPKIAQVLPELLAFIGSDIIVGHGICFDIDMIVAAAKGAQIDCHLAKNPFLDTLRMARLYGGASSNSLEALRKHFSIPEEGAHRAMSDVLVNIELFRALMKDYKSVQQLFKILEKPIAMRHMPLGKHKQRPFSEIPLSYLKWASYQDFDRDLLFSIRSEIKRRNKGANFASSNNPFKDLQL